jgi:hypothetical protein
MIGASGKRLVFCGYRWGIEWKPRYLFIGGYWFRIGNSWDLWVCLIPCLALHISWWYHDPGQ